MFFTDEEKREKLLSGKDLESLLDGSDYEQGQLEDMESTVNISRKCLARLLRLLVEKQVISVDEAVSIIP